VKELSKCKKKRKVKRLKKRLFVIVFLFAVAVAFFLPSSPMSVTANQQSNQNIRDQIGENVDNTLNNINMGDLDQIVNDLRNNQLNLFGGSSFTQRVGRILSGEFHEEYDNMFSALFSLFGGFILDILPLIMLIVGIAILSGFIQSLRTDTQSDGVRDLVHFVTYAAVVVIVMFVVADVVLMVSNALSSMQRQMEIIFPILLTLMVSVGATSSAGVYQPAVAILTQGVMQIFTTILMPLFIIVLVFSVVGHLSPKTKLDKFVSFFTSAYKWILGIVFTVFLGFLTIQGISAGAHDGVSIRAARFTISSYVPILGGYISQGFDLVMASSILIKNAIGVTGMFLLFASVLAPIAYIVVLSLGLKLAAAITQPIADARISDFLTTVNKAFSMLLSVLIGAAFMYFITIGLIIITGNVV